MLLAIDIGNTNSVFALTEGDAVRATWRCVTDAKRTADEYGAWLTQLMGLDWIEPQRVTAVVISTVVPETLFNVVGMCRRYFRCEPLVVGDPAVRVGVEAKVDRPREVGADRIVNALSAHRRYGGPAIVIDFGTATTFDVIDKVVPQATLLWIDEDGGFVAVDVDGIVVAKAAPAQVTVQVSDDV